MENTKNLVDMASKIDGGWDIYWSKIRLVLYISLFGSVLIEL